MSTANAYWNRTKLIINTFWFIICVATFSNTLHAEEQLTDSTPAEEQITNSSLSEEQDKESTSTVEQIEDSTPKDNEIKNFQASEKLKAKELKIIWSESDLEQLKIYEENLEPEQRIFQGVLNFESKLGNKILDILLAPKKPKNTVFRQPATVLIAPHSYHPSQLQRAFNSNESSELFTMHKVKDACELAELLEELQDDGILEPLSEHKHVFLVADAADMEKLSITGFERLYHDYGKPVAKHKDTIIKVAIGAAAVAVAVVGYHNRGDLIAGAGKIGDYFNSDKSTSTSYENVTYRNKIGINVSEKDVNTKRLRLIIPEGANVILDYGWESEKKVDGEPKVVPSQESWLVSGDIDLLVPAYDPEKKGVLNLSGLDFAEVAPPSPGAEG